MYASALPALAPSSAPSVKPAANELPFASAAIAPTESWLLVPNWRVQRRVPSAS